MEIRSDIEVCFFCWHIFHPYPATELLEASTVFWDMRESLPVLLTQSYLFNGVVCFVKISSALRLFLYVKTTDQKSPSATAPPQCQSPVKAPGGFCSLLLFPIIPNWHVSMPQSVSVRASSLCLVKLKLSLHCLLFRLSKGNQNFLELNATKWNFEYYTILWKRNLVNNCTTKLFYVTRCWKMRKIRCIDGMKAKRILLSCSLTSVFFCSVSR